MNYKTKRSVAQFRKKGLGKITVAIQPDTIHKCSRKLFIERSLWRLIKNQTY